MLSPQDAAGYYAGVCRHYADCVNTPLYDIYRYAARHAAMLAPLVTMLHIGFSRYMLIRCHFDAAHTPQEPLRSSRYAPPRRRHAVRQPMSAYEPPFSRRLPPAAARATEGHIFLYATTLPFAAPLVYATALVLSPPRRPPVGCCRADELTPGCHITPLPWSCRHHRCHYAAA